MMELLALSLRDQDRDPMNRDIDNEAQGLAAEAAARQNTGRGAGGTAQPVEVRIDWNGMPRRARRLTVPGTSMGGLTPSPEGHSVALTVSSGGAGAGAGAGTDPSAGMYIINLESGQLTRVPPAAPTAGAPGGGDGRGRGGAAGGLGGGSNMVFARDGRTLFFRSGRTCSPRRSPISKAAPERRRRMRRQLAAGVAAAVAAVVAAERPSRPTSPRRRQRHAR